MRAGGWSMLLCAVRRILTPTVGLNRLSYTVPQAVNHVIRSIRLMATSPPVVSIEDARQSTDIEAVLAPLRKAVHEQVSYQFRR